MNLILCLLNRIFERERERERERESAFGENALYKTKKKTEKKKMHPLSFVKKERRRYPVGCIYFFFI